VVQKLKREFIYQAILDELSKGLRDCDIIEKLQIPHMSYYRYKRALSEQIANFKTKITEQDITLAEEILYNRLTHDRVNAAYKAARPENDNPDWQVLASQLAINLFTLKKEGIIAALNKKKNRGSPFDFSSGLPFAPGTIR
jgi:hypothetical protein